jgi:hypothetical protein
MNTINSLRRVLEWAIDYLDIVEGSAANDPDIAAIAQMIAAYDALAPKDNEWPDDAQWYTIDASGVSIWHTASPSFDMTFYNWRSMTGWREKVIDLPLGVDWRLCIWKRPEVAE